MKTSFLFLLLLGISILTGTVSCKKYQPPKPDNPYGLPDATQSGQDIFACLVNGKPWIAGNIDEAVVGTVHPNSLDVSGILSTGDEVEQMGLVIYQSIDNIEINIPYNLSDTAIIRSEMSGGGDSCFAGSAYAYGSPFYVYAVSGQLVITKLDTARQIVSGTFWMDIPSPYCDTVKITDGRFDIRYY